MFSPLSTFHPRWVSALAGTVLLLSSVPVGLAQKTPFVDVPNGAYYEDAAAALLQSGALDRTTTLRPADLATRAELVKLLVNVHGTTLLYPSVSSFDDISRNASSFPYFEAAADAGWVHGGGNCYQRFRPCYANPPDHVNRAEAAALLVRSFTLNSTGKAPLFPDNPQNQWYFSNIQTSADHCVLQGDDGTRTVRPAAFMNRAEMITMFYRASLNLQYGTDCGRQDAHITDVSTVSSSRVRLTFDRALSAARAEDAARYSISRSTTVQSAALIDSKTVELSLSSTLATGVSYLVTVSNLLAQDGTVFSDSITFGFTEPSGHVTGATAISGRHLQLTFDATLDANRAADASRYTVTAVAGGGTLAVQSAAILNSRTVDLTLSQDITSEASYDVTARNLLTLDGGLFTDTLRVKLTVPAGHITDATARSSRRIRLAFDTDLDTLRAAEASRFTLTRVSGVGAIGIQSVSILNSRTIELLLNADIASNVTYLVTATHLLTQSGVDFTESADVMLSLSSGVLDPGPDFSLLPAFLRLGTTSPILGTAKIFNNSEPFTVDEIIVAFTGDVTSIDQVRLYATADGRYLGGATLDPNDSASFILLVSSGLLSIPKSQEVSIYARAVLSPFDSGGVSGEHVQIDHFTVKGRGDWSTHRYSQSSTETYGIFETARSSFTGIANAGTSDASLIGGPGRTLGSFSFTGGTGDGRADLRLTNLAFQAGTSGGVTLSNVKLGADGSTERFDCSVAGSSISCSGLPESIGTVKSGRRTLTLYGDITIPTSSQSAGLQISLTPAGSANSAGAITWTDGTTSFTWVPFDESALRSTYYRQ